MREDDEKERLRMREDDKKERHGMRENDDKEKERVVKREKLEEKDRGDERVRERDICSSSPHTNVTHER